MKTLGSSDSLGALMSLCPVSDEHSPRGNHMYSLEYQSMLDGLEKEGCMEELGHIPEKKRRLSVEQVKALEKYFEVENKLEPERKVKLAQELGLQPRQVAVWFQNRRARWKTRQLERDYTALKANFDSLKQNYESLQHDKDSLLRKIEELKSKLNEENVETDICLNGETKMLDSNNNTKVIEPFTTPPSLSGGSDDVKLLNNEKGVADFKDGPSESDSSAILNEGNNNSPNASNSSCGGGGSLQNEQQQLSSSSPSSNNCFKFTYWKTDGLASVDNDNNNKNNNNVYHPEFVKLEEHDFFSGEDACNIFSDEAAPTLHWYSSEQWT